jgi:hypothetical protein
MAALFHRFSAALADLDAAAGLGLIHERWMTSAPPSSRRWGDTTKRSKFIERAPTAHADFRALSGRGGGERITGRTTCIL